MEPMHVRLTIVYHCHNNEKRCVVSVNIMGEMIENPIQGRLEADGRV